MDIFDKRIIDELSFDEQLSIADLAKSLSASERTVYRRVAKLIGDRVIKVIAVPNPHGKRGWALIGLKVLPGTFRKTVQELINNPSIYFVTVSMGRFDFIIGVRFHSVTELTNFVNFELSKTIGVAEWETMILSQPRKYYNLYWPPGGGELSDNTQPTGLNTPTKYAVDDVDRAILKFLMDDGLTRVARIAEALDLPERVIRNRIIRMKDHNLFTFIVMSNQQHVLRRTGALIGINVKGRSANSVIEEIIPNPAVVIASVTSGRFDIILSCRFANLDGLILFTKDVLPGIKGETTIDAHLEGIPLKAGTVMWPLPDSTDPQLIERRDTQRVCSANGRIPGPCATNHDEGQFPVQKRLTLVSKRVHKVLTKSGAERGI